MSYPDPTQPRSNYFSLQAHGNLPDAQPQPPRILVDPVVSGTPAVAATLSCTTGTWTSSPTSYAYQWLSNGATIGGATTNTHVVAAGESGKTTVCTVTATNAAGTGQEPSNGTAIP